MLEQVDDEPGIEIETVAYDDPVAARLIDELQADLTERYGGPDDAPVDPQQFAPPDGMFVVARSGAEVVACAGLRRHDAETVELKRMFVRAEHRRRGHAMRLLRRLEEHARRSGYRRLALETGTAQPEAMALYEAAGYQPLPGFGHYADEPESRAFVKHLD